MLWRRRGKERLPRPGRDARLRRGDERRRKMRDSDSGRRKDPRPPRSELGSRRRGRPLGGKRRSSVRGRRRRRRRAGEPGSSIESRLWRNYRDLNESLRLR